MQDSAIELDSISGTGAGASALPRLARQHLHDSVVAHLRKLIVESVFAPGAKLN